jgi:hypothetical protein
MTYLREKVLGNFKPSTTERQKAKAVDTRGDRDGNDDKHLAALRKCPCIITLKVPAGEVHHLKQGTGERGMGMRSSDRWGVPMSRVPHEELERQGSRNETRWLKDHGIVAPLDLAAALWNASPNVAVMTKIILAHRGKA